MALAVVKKTSEVVRLGSTTQKSPEIATKMKEFASEYSQVMEKLLSCTPNAAGLLPADPEILEAKAKLMSLEQDMDEIFPETAEFAKKYKDGLKSRP